jgi:prophage antirepressor-like protein
MKDILPFQYKNHEVRVYRDAESNPWWVAKDVCDVLGHLNHRDVVTRLDDDERGVERIYTPGGPQDMIVINESGFYNLVLRSNKREAKPFQKWVTSEVLPTIRKTGTYSMPGADIQYASYANLQRERAFHYSRENELKDQLIASRDMMLKEKDAVLSAKDELLAAKNENIELLKTNYALLEKKKQPQPVGKKRRRQHPMTALERETIVNLKRQGYRNYRISKMVDRDAASVRRVLAEEGFPPEGVYYPRKGPATVLNLCQPDVSPSTPQDERVEEVPHD